MADTLLMLLKIFVVLATAGSLLELGLQLELRQTVAGVRNLRFALLTLLWGFALGPALAVLLSRVLFLDEPYAIGLIVMSMVPGAAYLSILVNWARGDLGYSASALLLTCLGIVVFVPLVLPMIVAGVSVSAWAIAKPLIVLVLVPFVVGLAIRQRSERVVGKIHPFIKKIAGIGLAGCLVLTVLLYARGIVLSAGSRALLSLLLFYVLATLLSHVSAFGVPESQKRVLGLAICSRNSGPAMATVLSIPNVDGNAVVMVALGILAQAALSFPLARWLGKRAAATEGSAASADATDLN
jgi:BASS family bile acid:Na+ symporter